MKIVGRTDKGDKRPENQDRYIGGTLANGTSFGFVCDGMGGAQRWQRCQRIFEQGY